MKSRTEKYLGSKTRDLLTRSWESEANLSVFLFVVILLAFILPAIGFEKNHLRLYEFIAFSVAIITGIGIAWGERRLFVFALLVGTAAVVARGVEWWAPSHNASVISSELGLAAIITVIAVLLWQVFRPGPVTWMRIQGAIAIYLGLAFSWSHAYRLAYLLAPASFTFSGISPSDVSEWTNYSFGILTTVGYSEVTPIRPLSHALTSGEAVAGQLYLTVLVARLVSLQASSSRNQYKT